MAALFYWRNNLAGKFPALFSIGRCILCIYFMIGCRVIYAFMNEVCTDLIILFSNAKQEHSVS